MIHPPKITPKQKLETYQASNINDDDIKKYKKLNPTLAFKVIFEQDCIYGECTR